MANPYFDNHNEAEQNLIEDLINEAIDIHAETFYYVPRTLSSTAEIDIFNEDRNSIFKNAYPFSGYLENPNTGLEGNGYLMQKFGGIVDLSATITISRREWEKNIGSHGTTIIPNSPCTGDLIYWPTTDQLFEIKFVDDKAYFAQLGRFYTFKLTVELMQYSSQHIDTGMPEIDVFESLKTFDVDPDNSLWGGLVEVQIIDPGLGYQEPPEIVVDSLTGSNARAFVTLNPDDGSIAAIAIEDHGEGYHSTDQAYVIGKCEKKAIVQPIFRTIIENAGDAWGSNEAFIKEGLENSPDEWNPQDPFGTIEWEDINNYKKGQQY